MSSLAEETTSSPARLDAGNLHAAVDTLIATDSALASIVDRWGYPALWEREPGFATLVHIILEQQVSVASARATFRRLSDLIALPTPDTFLEIDPAELRRIGFSRQKIDYTRGIALALTSGDLDLDALAALSDEEARSTLIRLKGIGRWSADIYLLMALGRPDIWPEGDLALEIAAAELLELPARPRREESTLIAERWRPLRAVAARLLWHQYLQSRKS